MRITTWNVNGLRAAIRKDIAKHLDLLDTDVLLLQEIRCLPEQLPAMWQAPEGWHVYWHPAEKKGYSGTAIWSKYPIELLDVGMGEEDFEGRLIRARINGFQVVCVYLPSGSSSQERQGVKEKWMEKMAHWLKPLEKLDEPVVVGGDINIAHTARDIFYAKSNEKASGFLPHERQWIDELLHVGWHDLVREQFGDIDGPYSWWSNRGNARALDRGWRIDYLLANAAAHAKFGEAAVHRAGGLEVSDHAPVWADFGA